MPFARGDVVGDRRLELDLDVPGRTGMHAERVRKRLVGQFLDRRESLLEQRDVPHPLERERADLAVLGHVRQQVQTSLRVSQPVRMHEIRFRPVAGLRMVSERRLPEVQRRFKEAGGHLPLPRIVALAHRVRL